MKERRKKAAIRRKNFFATLAVTVVLWLILTFIVFFVDPDWFGAIYVFFAVLFFALLFTLSALLANTRRGFIFSFALTLFLILRYFGVGNLLNLGLIFGIAAALEIYYTSSTN